MTLKDELKTELSAYDGKAVTVLSELAARRRGEAGFTAALADLASEPEGDIAAGATWLLKAEIDAGRALPASALVELVTALPGAPDWQAALHICQIFAAAPPPSDCANDLAAALDPLLIHARPFLRAWSLAALITLANCAPEYAGAALASLRAATADPAASVRARARKLRV